MRRRRGGRPWPGKSAAGIDRGGSPSFTRSTGHSMSPWFNPAPNSWKRRVANGGLQLDQSLARRGDDCLQLGVDLQLLDDVADVPLDGVRGESEPAGHGCRVKTFREQVQDVELTGRELGQEL